jgi:MFS family permease
MSVAVIPISQEHNWDNQTQSFVLSSFFYGYISTQLVGGYFADRIGGKIVFGLGVIWACTFSLLLPFVVHSPILVMASRVLVGIGQGELGYSSFYE